MKVYKCKNLKRVTAILIASSQYGEIFAGGESCKSTESPIKFEKYTKGTELIKAEDVTVPEYLETVTAAILKAIAGGETTDFDSGLKYLGKAKKDIAVAGYAKTSKEVYIYKGKPTANDVPQGLKCLVITASNGEDLKFEEIIGTKKDKNS